MPLILQFGIAMANGPDGAYDGHAYKDCHGIWLNKDQSQHSGFIARRPLVDGFFDALRRFYSEIPFVEHI